MVIIRYHAGFPTYHIRRAISSWYKDRYEISIDSETEAIVTIGSKEGLAHLMLATLDCGNTILDQTQAIPFIFMVR